MRKCPNSENSKWIIKELSYKAPNVQLNEDRIEEVLNKEMDNLQKAPLTESLSKFDTSSESINKLQKKEIGFDIISNKSYKQDVSNSEPFTSLNGQTDDFDNGLLPSDEECVDKVLPQTDLVQKPEESLLPKKVPREMLQCCQRMIS